MASMPKLRVHNLAMSLDGYVAGPHQSVDDGLGVGGEALHEWMFGDRHEVDERFYREGEAGIGATIMGRNMFGPVRGAWPDDTWKGWWGDNPPYRVPVFVLTHHARAPVTMAGGTTFHFVTDGIEVALERARSRRRQGRARWRRRGDDPAIFAGEAGRRDACRDRAGAARQRRGAVRRARFAGARLRADGARADGEGDACGDQEAGVSSCASDSARSIDRRHPEVAAVRRPSKDARPAVAASGPSSFETRLRRSSG